jgi:hypothetical protein
MSALSHVNYQNRALSPFLYKLYILKFLFGADGMPVFFLDDDRKKAHG